MQHWISYFSLFLLSTVKLVLGSVPLAIVYEKSQQLPIYYALTVCMLGGFCGIIIFTSMGSRIWTLLDKSHWYRNYKKKNPSKYKSRKRILKIRDKYGLWGIAFLSPVLLSVPGGCLLASRFYKEPMKIYVAMAVSVIIWVWGSGLILSSAVR